MRANGWRWVWGVVVVCGVMATSTISPAQAALTTLVSLVFKSGINPYSMVLTQGADGNFYGTIPTGGLGAGTVFRVTPSGKFTLLHAFSSGADGGYPQGSLVQATNGLLYGTTNGGGDNQRGTVFEMTIKGALTTLHSFNGIDGSNPWGGLVQAANGDFYGTTGGGGAHGSGTVFKMTAAGSLTTLYSFCSVSACADGQDPVAALVQGTNGNFYGVTALGGINSEGTVFQITPEGKLTTVYTFCSLTNCADGSSPEASLVQAIDGNFYGTTYRGGAGEFCSTTSCGTVFKITPTGTFSTLYNFCSLPACADGRIPFSSLVQATDGNFYGTTFSDGAYSGGTVFELTPAGTLTTAYNFCSVADCADGSAPYAGLLQATNGSFYGTTYLGGTHNYGTIFSLNTGLAPPFVSFVRNPAKIGQQFGILGYGLAGTTSVSFNGITASFKPQSDTLLIATVPSDATTGYVTVTTPSGTLTSNVPFRVIR